MVTATNNSAQQTETWVPYLSRAAEKILPAAIAGYCVSVNPAGAAVSGATALTLFLLDSNRDINLFEELVTHVSYIVLPAVLAKYSQSDHYCPITKIPVPRQTCSGIIGGLYAAGSYLSFNLINGMTDRKSVMTSVAATCSSCFAAVTFCNFVNFFVNYLDQSSESSLILV